MMEAEIREKKKDAMMLALKMKEETLSLNVSVFIRWKRQANRYSRGFQKEPAPADTLS